MTMQIKHRPRRRGDGAVIRGIIGAPGRRGERGYLPLKVAVMTLGASGALLTV